MIELGKGSRMEENIMVICLESKEKFVVYFLKEK